MYPDTGGQLILGIPTEIGGVVIGRYLIAPSASWLWNRLSAGFRSAAERFTASAGGDAARVTINGRTSQLIVEGRGVNITPKSIIERYRVIGSGNRTFVTDLKAVEDVIGPLRGDTVTITTSQARQLENALGLTPNSLEFENVITFVDNLAERAPAAPTSGNNFFLGPGKGLPGGGPELTITGVPSQEAADGVSRITLLVNNTGG